MARAFKDSTRLIVTSVLALISLEPANAVGVPQIVAPKRRRLGAGVSRAEPLGRRMQFLALQIPEAIMRLTRLTPFQPRQLGQP